MVEVGLLRAILMQTVRFVELAYPVFLQLVWSTY